MTAKLNRRELVKTVGLVSAAGAFTSHAAAEKISGDWGEVRALFQFSEKHVPMNAANMCPMPKAVAAALDAHNRRIDGDPSKQSRAALKPLVETARARAAKLLNVKSAEIALVRNTTEANNVIVRGFPLDAGDEVVLWDQNHESNNASWDLRAARDGFAVKRVSLSAGGFSVDQVVDLFQAALSPKTRLLSLTHVANGSGVRLPVAEIAAKAQARGVFVHVDGAQTWGADDLDLPALGADAYSASGQKWMMGPRETGILYVREAWIERISAPIVGLHWTGPITAEFADARRFEGLGQRDTAALAALGEALAFYERLGPARVAARATALADRLRNGFAGAGIPLVSPEAAPFTSPVVIARAASDRRQEINDRLYHEFGIAGAKNGGMRLTPHVYNTDDHIERAIAAATAMRAAFG